jgi:hypothetical protein
MKPHVRKNFFEPRLLKLIQFQVDLIKKSSVETDTKTFNRKQFHNHPLLRALHLQMAEEASEIFGEELKPSYVFLSMYLEGKGECPLHVDRPQCYRTIDVCLNQRKPWGIYVNDSMSWDEGNQDEIRATATRYELEPGDALLYSGTDHPHFRVPMKNCPDQADNFVDLAFFHFVPKSFEGALS